MKKKEDKTCPHCNGIGEFRILFTKGPYRYEECFGCWGSGEHNENCVCKQKEIK